MVTEEELAKPVKQLDKEGREDGEETEEWEDELEAEVETDHSSPKRCKKSRTSAIRKTRVVLHIFKIFTGIV